MGNIMTGIRLFSHQASIFHLATRIFGSALFGVWLIAGSGQDAKAITNLQLAFEASVCSGFTLRQAKDILPVIRDRKPGEGRRFSDFAMRTLIVPSLEPKEAETYRLIVKEGLEMSEAIVRVYGKITDAEQKNISRFISEVTTLEYIIAGIDGRNISPITAIKIWESFFNEVSLKYGRNFSNYAAERYKFYREAGKDISTSSTLAIVDTDIAIDRAANPAAMRGIEDDIGRYNYRVGLQAQSLRSSVFLEEDVGAKNYDLHNHSLWRQWLIWQHKMFACFDERQTTFKRLAHSPNQGLEVLAEKDTEGRWCNPNISLLIESRDPNFLISDSVTEFLPKVKTVLTRECTIAKKVSIKGFSDSNRAKLLDANLSISDSWAITPPKLNADQQAFIDRLTKANAGDQISQGWLGYHYFEGVGVTQNGESADYWLELAARNGDNYGKAFYAARLSLEPGSYYSLDPVDTWALDMAREAAEVGDPAGNYFMAYMTYPFLSLKGSFKFFGQMVGIEGIDSRGRLVFDKDHRAAAESLNIKKLLSTTFEKVLVPHNFAENALAGCSQEPYLSDVRYKKICRLAAENIERAQGAGKAFKGLGNSACQKGQFGWSCNAGVDTSMAEYMATGSF